MRYDELFERAINRALATVEVDLAAFFEEALALGTSPEALERRLLDDLHNEGPIFGKFLSNAVGAAESAAMAAKRVGTFVGQLGDDSEEAALAIASGDPEALQAIEDQNSDVPEVWICELVNTCHRCLPLHGVVLSRGDWNSKGLAPETIHSGWNSICHCERVREDLAASRKSLLAPLIRVPLKTAKGLRGSRKTVMSVAQKDLEKSIKAIAEARQSIVGRRTLRLLGMSNLLVEAPVIHPQQEGI